jgi:hypothetical protein
VFVLFSSVSSAYGDIWTICDNVYTLGVSYTKLRKLEKK